MAKDSGVETWWKRIRFADDLHTEWDKRCRVKECYNYYIGDQLVEPFDEFGVRRAQINKIHPEVRNNIPSLYYYRPFARLNAAPEYSDDPGTSIEDDTQILQDTVNHLIRDPQTLYRESTFLALKEAHWAMGCVEVGYSAEFVDAPEAERPALLEKEDTKISKPVPAEAPAPSPLTSALTSGPAPAPDPLAIPAPPEPPAPGLDALGLGVDGDSDLTSILAEVDRLKGQLKKETFYVKHIPANRILVSISDMPIVTNNDWVGYWEDVPLEDVKRSAAYQNTKDLRPATGDPKEEKDEQKYNEASGSVDRIRLFKLWDLRTKERIVLAKGHDKYLLRKPYKRFPLKFLRFDVDPYHFYPRPLIFPKLGPQDEYNHSREYLRKIRNATVPRYTYDEGAVTAENMQKLESGVMGTYVPRTQGTSDPIQPINQPSFSENAIQTLTLSDKEFADVGGVGNDSRVAQTKTATQAKIAETKNQVQDSFDRLVVAEWLGNIARELLQLAIDNMNLDRMVAINVAPDNQFAPQIKEKIAGAFQRVNANILSNASAGVSWDVVIDIESLSPVSEQEKKQEFMEGLMLMANPPLARLLSVSPPLLERALHYIGIDSAKDRALIEDSVKQVVQMEQMLAMQGQNASPGVSPQPGSGRPGSPAPGGAPPPPKMGGGPQPGGPQGPGASAPKAPGM